jgi:hypothetical protein
MDIKHINKNLINLGNSWSLTIKVYGSNPVVNDRIKIDYSELNVAGNFIHPNPSLNQPLCSSLTQGWKV